MIAEKPLLAVLGGATLKRPPVWFMRQAGRYLPEYRSIRAQAGSFLNLCYNPELAAEVTLQPIERFHFDAAILFADILLVPHALGQDLSFVENEGPRLTPIANVGDLSRLRNGLDQDRVGRVYETVKLVRERLPADVALIGFCGAPWTVATYMVSGGKDRSAALLWALRDPDGFAKLIDRLVSASVDYLCHQIDAGAEAVQIFDSWAGELSPALFSRWCIEPVKAIMKGVKARHPLVPVIAFPRGAGSKTSILSELGADAIGIDTAEDPVAVRSLLGKTVPLQGNLDPLALIAGGRTLDDAIAHVLSAMSGGPHIFNLGHGIRPDTPIEHVEQAVRRIRGD